MAATIGPGGPAMADSHAINGPPGLTMAVRNGGGLTMAGSDQLRQPQSVRGDHLCIYGTRDCHSWSPRTDCGWDQLARDRPIHLPVKVATGTRYRARS